MINPLFFVMEEATSRKPLIVTVLLSIKLKYFHSCGFTRISPDKKKVKKADLLIHNTLVQILFKLVESFDREEGTNAFKGYMEILLGK